MISPIPGAVDPKSQIKFDETFFKASIYDVDNHLNNTLSQASLRFNMIYIAQFIATCLIWSHDSGDITLHSTSPFFHYGELTFHTVLKNKNPSRAGLLKRVCTIGSVDHSFGSSDYAADMETSTIEYIE